MAAGAGTLHPLPSAAFRRGALRAPPATARRTLPKMAPIGAFKA